MTKAKVETMLKKEKKEASASSIDLNHLMQLKQLSSLVPQNIRCTNSRSLMTRRVTPCSTLCTSLIQRSLTHNYRSLFKRILDVLTDKAYTWYANLKLGTMHDQEHLVSFLNIKFFHAKAKVHPSRAWLHRPIFRRSPRRILRRFHERALDCCDQVDEEILVNVYLHVIAE